MPRKIVIVDDRIGEQVSNATVVYGEKSQEIVEIAKLAWAKDSSGNLCTCKTCKYTREQFKSLGLPSAMGVVTPNYYKETGKRAPDWLDGINTHTKTYP